MAAGKAALAEPLKLFVLPEAAGCRVVESAVEMLQEDHEHAEEGQEAEEHAGEAASAEDEHEHGGELHSEFRGSYILDCADPGALTRITFAWFDQYANAKEVEVTLVTTTQQTSYEVKRGDPPLAIGAAS